MNRLLKEQVKDYFEEFELTEKQFLELESAQDSAQKEKNIKKFSRYLGLVAASLVIFAFVGYFWRTIPKQMNLETLPQEIAYHHNKQMDSEIRTQSYSEMKVFLSKLDFNLIQSKRLPSENWELLGGRYCSLQGRLAAQIRVKNKKSNKTYTLYQLTMPKNLKGQIDPIETYSGGAKIKIWSENDLLLGIAGDE